MIPVRWELSIAILLAVILVAAAFSVTLFFGCKLADLVINIINWPLVWRWLRGYPWRDAE